MQLIRYEAARTALAAVHSYDEVKDIMDQAERAAVYARQANDSELIKYATEIRVRAQRRAGEMLAKTPKATGAMGVGKSALPEEKRTQPTLAEMGVTHKQSANWQSLASMSEEHFEATVEAAKDTAGEVTTAFMLREAKKVMPAKASKSVKLVSAPKKGKRAKERMAELKAAQSRGVSMLCAYARLVVEAIQSSDSFTEEEMRALSELHSAINKLGGSI